MCKRFPGRHEDTPQMQSKFKLVTLSLLRAYIDCTPFAFSISRNDAADAVVHVTDAAKILQFFDRFCRLLVTIAIIPTTTGKTQDETLLKIVWILMLAVHHPSAAVLDADTIYHAFASIQGDRDIRHWIIKGLHLNDANTVYVNASLDELEALLP
jgi:hypothetical protein